jgi:oligoribonuclease NrnB/cAMP/cGMP phosphodiesterase (DHH superfamily)
MNNTTILFHGNCIDGWFSAYFAYSNLQSHGEIQMFPIAPSQPNTWPTAEAMANTHIWLLDVSVPEHARKKWLEAGALTIQCIDHHATAKEHWSSENNPIHTECCAALQTFRFFYPDMEEPEWLHSIDRVDRWENVTYEDRCLREYLHEIARKPVQHQLHQAFEMSNQFMYCMEHHPESFASYCAHGEKILKEKDEHLMGLIMSKGNTIVINDHYIALWYLPQSWHGLNVFIMNTTDIVLDTTEASHLVFTQQPNINIFINYRSKSFYSKHDTHQIMKGMVVYSARTRTLDVTEGTIFRGHPTSAGASLVRGEVTHFPFLL